MIMLAQELISTVVPVLNPLDTGAKALRLMNEFHLTQLPLVVDNKYASLVEGSQNILSRCLELALH